jgi:hypothetical protein
MDISFGTYNNILDASSITFKKDAITGLEIKYDHGDSILHLGEKISVEDKVIVNKTFTVYGSETVNDTLVLTVDGGNKSSNNLAIEMNIGDKLVFAHKNSPKPLYLTTNNKNDGDGAGNASAYETGVTYISRASNSGAYNEDTTIAAYAGRWTDAQDTRTLQFIPTESGKFYINYYSDGTVNYKNFYIPVTVNRPTDRVEQKSRDLSFNENVSVAKKLSVLGNSEFSNHAVFSDVSLNANTFVSNIEVTDSSFANLNCAGETDLSNAFIKVGEVETLTTRNPTISNRIFDVTVAQHTINATVTNKYKLNDMWSSEVNPVINVGETITFNQNNIGTDISTAHAILIYHGDIHRAGSDDNGATTPGHVVHGDPYTYITTAATNERKVSFSTTVPGTYYYQSFTDLDMGGSFTVVDRDNQAEVVNKDMSFNGNIDIDFSSNYAVGQNINKRMRFIFHPDYTN